MVYLSSKDGNERAQTHVKFLVRYPRSLSFLTDIRYLHMVDIFNKRRITRPWPSHTSSGTFLQGCFLMRVAFYYRVFFYSGGGPFHSNIRKDGCAHPQPEDNKKLRITGSLSPADGRLHYTVPVYVVIFPSPLIILLDLRSLEKQRMFTPTAR